ncbi:unnamed protein product [Trichogramma brassicae]|uniref:Uncharacterized protein n=1 Tax=Trichogramma brassicae TaxID=86971 RepID=A0A6H5I6W7_9HYME|nr:unnamed protein product [Trichogramma brassicae]
MSDEQPPIIDNEHCALLEFTGGELKVGYLAWITCRSATTTTTTTTTSASRNSSSSSSSSRASSESSTSTPSWLDRAIERREIVRVKWPVDCQVESAKRMRTLSKRCDWQYRTARIVDHGEWTAMCERRRNYHKFNQLDLDKNERKNRKRKFTSLASNSIGRAAPPEQITQQQQQRVVIDKVNRYAGKDICEKINHIRICEKGQRGESAASREIDAARGVPRGLRSSRRGVRQAGALAALLRLHRAAQSQREEHISQAQFQVQLSLRHVRAQLLAQARPAQARDQGARELALGMKKII